MLDSKEKKDKINHIFSDKLVSKNFKQEKIVLEKNNRLQSA